MAVTERVRASGKDQSRNETSINIEQREREGVTEEEEMWSGLNMCCTYVKHMDICKGNPRLSTSVCIRLMYIRCQHVFVYVRSRAAFVIQYGEVQVSDVEASVLSYFLI